MAKETRQNNELGVKKISEWVNEVMGDSVYFYPIRRGYINVPMNYALALVERIGKQRKRNFVIDNENRFLYENLIYWVHGDEKRMKAIDAISGEIIAGDVNKGIYIAGSTGTGKSWALEVIEAYSRKVGAMFRIGKNTKILRWQNIRADIICDFYTEHGTFESFKKETILGIQDLGAEPPESMYMGNRLNVLRQILEYRGDSDLLFTLITSNIPIHDENKLLSKSYGSRVASRLIEMCNYFELVGKDRRLIN